MTKIPVKMKVRAGNYVYDVVYTRNGDIINVRVDDREYTVDSLSVYEGFYSILIDGRSVETLVRSKGNRFTVGYGGQEFEVEFFDPRARKPAKDIGEPVAEGKQHIKAPMAGRIVSVLVKKGDTVREGSGLVILEAMKMENKLVAQGTGKVLDVLVSDKDTVDSGQALMIVEMGKQTETAENPRL